MTDLNTDATMHVTLPEGMTQEEADRLVREADEAVYAAEAAAKNQET